MYNNFTTTYKIRVKHISRDSKFEIIDTWIKSITVEDHPSLISNTVTVTDDNALYELKFTGCRGPDALDVLNVLTRTNFELVNMSSQVVDEVFESTEDYERAIIDKDYGQIAPVPEQASFEGLPQPEEPII